MVRTLYERGKGVLMIFSVRAMCCHYNLCVVLEKMRDVTLSKS